MNVMRTKDGRGTKRKALRYPVWLDDGEGALPTECMLSDVSEGGAKLSVSANAVVPQTFRLRLTRGGPPARLCELVWRDGLEVGIKFLKLLAPPTA